MTAVLLHKSKQKRKKNHHADNIQLVKLLYSVEQSVVTAEYCRETNPFETLKVPLTRNFQTPRSETSVHRFRVTGSIIPKKEKVSTPIIPIKVTIMKDSNES
jgi:hypothetical protein